jgi:hypothetical protein
VITEPALQQAAVLLAHWHRRDIEAVVLLSAGFTDQECRDVITGLLILSGAPQQKVADIVSRALVSG